MVELELAEVKSVKKFLLDSTIYGSNEKNKCVIIF